MPPNTAYPSNTGPSTHTRFIAGPSGVCTSHSAPSTTTDSTRHVLLHRRMSPPEIPPCHLQRTPSRQASARRQKPQSQPAHPRSTSSNPLIRQLSNNPIKAPRKFRPAGQPAGNAPFIHHRHTSNSAIRNPGHHNLRRPNTEREEESPTPTTPTAANWHQYARAADPPETPSAESHTPHQSIAPAAVPDAELNPCPIGQEHADLVPRLPRRQGSHPGPTHPEANLNPTLLCIRAHNRQRPTHGNQRVSGDVYKRSRRGMGSTLGRLKPDHSLISVKHHLRQNRRIPEGKSSRDCVWTCA